jgi:hypothetical protein
VIKHILVVWFLTRFRKQRGAHLWVVATAVLTLLPQPDTDRAGGACLHTAEADNDAFKSIRAAKAVSRLMGGRPFGGADHGWQDVGLKRRAWTLSLRERLERELSQEVVIRAQGSSYFSIAGNSLFPGWFAPKRTPEERPRAFLKIRAHPAGHLLCRAADREKPSQHDREGNGPVAQERL